MFLNDDYLLTTKAAKKLYHEYAEVMPIIDYHCHLSPQEIYEDKNFENLTQAWLYGDHYKWRLMRANGVDENLITGDASDYDKFYAWAQTLPSIIGNPLYAWTHLELKRFFGIDKILNEDSAKEIYDEVNEKLATAEYSRRSIIKNAGVKLVVTTDDPIDNLEYHDMLLEEDLGFQVKPAFRPDACFNIDAKSYVTWFEKLQNVIGKEIRNFKEYQDALAQRVEFFNTKGCVLSDHGLDSLVYIDATQEELDLIFNKAIKGETLSSKEVNQFKTSMLNFLISCYHKHGWTMQLHLKAVRNANQRMFKQLGPDTGYDSISDETILVALKQLLDFADFNKQLPKTILYSLNPNDTYPLVTLMQCYQEGGVKQKLQLGSAWWFNDTRSGMRHQIQSFADNSNLANFVGMLTDSRSFLSYTRHEYFRRVLCELVGEWVERGEAPEDYELLGKIISDISFNNANEYFNFNV